MNPRISEEPVTILVYSWDTYKACWPVFCHGMAKYWPDCPYRLLFITNHLDPPSGECVKVGDVNDFVSKLTIGLGEVSTPLVLFMHEDYWIDKAVNTSAIRDYARLIAEGEADYIRLFPMPGPNRLSGFDPRLGIVDGDAEYRVSLMASIWRKSVLEDLLIPGESLWQFEDDGSKRSRKYGDRFLSVFKSDDGISYPPTAITNRQWTREAYEYARLEGIEVDFHSLPLPPWNRLAAMNLRASAYRLKRRARGTLSRLIRRRVG